MPTPEDIRLGLTRLANDWLPLAVTWHVLLLVVLALLSRPGTRPSRRGAALALAAPLASVSTFAWVAHNAFNGLVFAIATVGFVFLGGRLEATPLARGPRWAFAVGALSVLYGWSYPHFLVGEPGWMYLVAAPLGLVPCPTLAVVLGLGLCADAFGSRAWAFTAGALGLFYGLFGVLRLGVVLDVGLLVAALATVALGLGHLRPHPAGPGRSLRHA